LQLNLQLLLFQASAVAVGLFQTVKNLWVSNGINAFYPGVLPYMAADGLSGAVKFATFEVSKVFLEGKLPAKFHPSLQFICAAGAMVACSFIMVPGEVIKIRLQAGLCETMTEGITQTLKLDGIGGLFAGDVMSCICFCSDHCFELFSFLPYSTDSALLCCTAEHFFVLCCAALNCTAVYFLFLSSAALHWILLCSAQTNYDMIIMIIFLFCEN
jgi:Mitochondrial carrier protein